MGQQCSQLQCEKNKNLINKNTKYQLLSKISIRWPELCQAISISKDSQTVVAACDNKIKVFQFNGEMLQQISVLNEHKAYVDILFFMNKTNSFISAASDNLIIIWLFDSQNKITIQKKLLGHTYYIRCMTINYHDNLIISSGCDKTIRFWNKANFWECCQIINNHNNWVFALSLNEKDNTLISCGQDVFILVFKYSQDNNLWYQVQKIQTDFGSYRLCFATDNCFIFQPLNQNILQFFILNEQDKLYEKGYEIKINGCQNDSCFFPSQYIKEQQLAIFKNGCYLNFIKMENNQFTLNHSIQFDHNSLFGSISSDGQYLFTWDNKQQQLQVRKTEIL